MSASGTLREAVSALAVQLALLALFLGSPLLRYGEVHYTSADLLQSMSLTQVEPYHRPANQLLSDGVTQMQPWALFNRSELRQGRFPLWNPHNGTGTPHFANYQSAVLSPFSVPFYVLDFKPALLVAAALKLAALGLLTYLALRALGCGWLAATAGGVAFEFCGHNVVLLGFPHVPALATLPAGLYFAELALGRVERALERGERARLSGPLAGTCASFALGLLAGNPEPFYFAALAVGAWTALRAARLASRWRGARGPLRELTRVSAALAGAIALAAGLAAVQLLPFLDYLGRCLLLEQRSGVQTPLELRWWPLLVFPDALGNPASAYNLSETIPPPNYELVAMRYGGGALLLLAALCPFVARRRRGGLFFPLAAVFWFVYAHDVGGLARLLAHVPTVGLAPMNRSQGVWCFLVACAAAIALDALLARRAGRSPGAAAATLLACGVALALALVGADRLIGEFALVESPNHGRFLAHVPAHLAAMCAWTGAAAVGCAVLLVVHAPAVRTLAAALVAGSFFAQTGWLLRDYNPVCPDALAFPRTPALERLAARVGGERVAVLGQDSLPPDTNLVYGLDLLASYDGMWPRELDRLYRDRFGDGDNWRPVLRGSARDLRVFATRWVLAKWGWNFLDSGLRHHPRDGSAQPQRLVLGPGRPVTQTFLCEQPGLSRVMAVLSTQPQGRDCVLRVRIEEEESGRLVHEEALTCAELRASLAQRTHVTWPGEPRLSPPGRPVVFRFGPLADSARMRYRLTLACEDELGEESVIAWHMPVLGYGKGEARYGGRPLPGELLFDWSCDEERRFETVEEIGDYALLRLRDAVPTHLLVDEALVLPSEALELELLRCPSFDPRRAVVLAPIDAAERERVERERAAARDRTVLQFDDSDHCYLLGEDGRTLAHVEDEVAFTASGLSWRRVRRVAAAERERYDLVSSADREAQQRMGLRSLPTGRGERGTLALLEDEPARTRLRVERERPGYLLVAKAWDPGWLARVDGEPVPVRRANHGFQALALPAGRHEVELVYRPRALVLGSLLSATSAGVALLALLLARRARRRRLAPAAP